MGVEIRQKIGFSLFLVQKISPKTPKTPQKHSEKHAIYTENIPIFLAFTTILTGF
jgi:hypothetical protein